MNTRNTSSVAKTVFLSSSIIEQIKRKLFCLIKKRKPCRQCNAIAYLYIVNGQEVRWTLIYSEDEEENAAIKQQQ